MDAYFGQSVPKLGFGLMRLPRKAGFTDIEQTKAMVDLFLEAGFTYFDTAFVYLGSEKAIKAALVDRYPRDRYTLATKINAFMMAPTESAPAVSAPTESAPALLAAGSVGCDSVAAERTSPSTVVCAYLQSG